MRFQDSTALANQIGNTLRETFANFIAKIPHFLTNWLLDKKNADFLQQSFAKFFRNVFPVFFSNAI